MTSRWDKYYLDLALRNAQQSKDPDTQVGAVLVMMPDHEPVSIGFNGFPRGIDDHYERLIDKDIKRGLMVHAEMNAILNAARLGHRTKGCTLYFVATDSSGKVWGGPPCTQCVLGAIQAGIVEVVSPPFKTGESRWREDINRAGAHLVEAGIKRREVDYAVGK